MPLKAQMALKCTVETQPLAEVPINVWVCQAHPEQQRLWTKKKKKKRTGVEAKVRDPV